MFNLKLNDLLYNYILYVERVLISISSTVSCPDHNELTQSYKTFILNPVVTWMSL